MISLFIDTSLSDVSIALVKDNKLISEIKNSIPGEHSVYVTKYIDDVLKECNLSPKDIDEIIVVNGPGSFTGIRIGITIAKVYAWSLNIPITTISSLEAMMLSSKENKVKVPMIDARRRYVFGAIYDENNNVVLKPQHIKMDDINVELEKLSDYTIITKDELEEYEHKEEYNPDILKIVTYFKDKEPINPHGVNPDYLKLTEAEESKLN